MSKEPKGLLSIGFSLRREDGFTIIELIIAAALSLVVMGGIYSVYRSQQDSYIVREQITIMQQNLRAGMVVMTSDIRMAGYLHPNITSLATNPGITQADNDELTFTLLKDKSDNPLSTSTAIETIKYSLANNQLIRTYNDSVNEDNQVIAENIDALNFFYLKEDGTEAAALSEIKSIQVTMVARTGRRDLDYSDSTINPVYTNQQGDTIFSPGAGTEADNFRRRLLSREIKCRNL